MARVPTVIRLALALATCQPLPGAQAAAQPTPPPNRGGFTTSMGVPRIMKLFVGSSGGVHRGELNEATAYVVGTAYRDLLSPSSAALGLNVDLYGGRRGSFDRWGEGWDWGLRLGLFSPVTRLAFGADYNGLDRDVDFFVSLIHPFKRGGILVDGGALRVDYIPGRHHTTAIGFSLPVGQRFAGKTRALKDFVVLGKARPVTVPYTPERSMVEATANARELSLWITRLTIPFIDQWNGDWDKSMGLFTQELVQLRAHLASDPAPLYQGRRTPDDETRAFHREMERAFSVATSGRDLPIGASTPLGVATWAKARDIILTQVILPYDRLLGQKKKNDTTMGYGTEAAAAFYEWLSAETPIPMDRLAPTAWAFQEVLNIVEGVRRAEEDHWKNSRFIFLPFQLVLKPEEHDTQEELDAILARAVDGRIQPGNLVYYVENERFQFEFAKMVREAKRYTVLWIHDFRGYAEPDKPDGVAYLQTLTYLRALIDAVNAYGRTGRIPQHILLVDQWYFQANGGTLFIDLLQNPLHHHVDLPKGYEEWEAELEKTQDELRAAVAGSPLLQAQARQFREGWIENVVRVHVNITNPADVSFWTGEVIPFIGFPDLVARDHRKIAFADLTEEDPYSGQAMFTGMGIGEHYVGAGWEDRALIVEGPAMLGLKHAARNVLLEQGFTEDEIPFELKPRPLVADYDEQVQTFIAQHPATVRALQTHNEVGYGQKNVDLLKATLYTLMPPGSVIKAPDSIWNLPLWGSMMLGNALRGGRSLVIAPSIEHAPSSGWPQMSRAQELMGRLIVAQTVLSDYLKETGGLMKVGLYTPDTDVGNTPAKMRQLVATIEGNAWLTDLYDFAPGTLEALERQADSLDAAGFNRMYPIDQPVVTAKLHLKAHLFASPTAWSSLLDGPEAEGFLSAYYRALAEQNRAISEGRGNERDAATLTAAIIPPALALIEAHVAELAPSDRDQAILYLTLGSHNQNFHSFTQAGEVAVVVARYGALHGLPDFITLVGLCTWVNDLEQLEELFPRYEGIRRRLSHWMRIAV